MLLASQEHPAVLESAAVASPDAQRGEIVKAFIILSAEYEEIMRGKGEKETNELILEIQVRFPRPPFRLADSDLRINPQDFVRKNASPYKYPRAIEFVDTLPKTVSGKVSFSSLSPAFSSLLIPACRSAVSSSGTWSTRARRTS